MTFRLEEELSDKISEIAKLEKKNTDFINKGVNIFAPLYWLHDALVDKKDAWGKTSSEEKKYTDLVQKRRQELTPTLVVAKKKHEEDKLKINQQLKRIEISSFEISFISLNFSHNNSSFLSSAISFIKTVLFKS